MFTRPTLPLLALLAACTGSSLEHADFAITSDAGTTIDGEFIVSADLGRDVLDSVGLEKVDFDRGMGAGLYRGSETLTRTALKAALSQHLFEAVSVEENRTTRALSNDTYRSLQWNLDMLSIETAWTYTRGAGVTVAVIDTGVSTIGVDTPVNYIAGWDFIGNDGDPSDENGHGTHVAGTIAQATDNGRGVAGVAPDTNLMGIRVLDRWGSGSVYDSARGIRYAVDNGADVINLSLGSPSASWIEEDAINYALSNGVIVVAASGNDGGNTVDYPGAYPGVLAVGAVGATGSVVGYSTGGNAMSVVAPGGDMGRDANGDGYADGILQETLSGYGTNYQFFEGTSMAAPHAAGLAALLLSAGAQPSDVDDLIIESAMDIGSTGWDSRSGYGLIDPVGALQLLGANSAPPSTGGGEQPPQEEPPQSDTTAPVISGVTGERTSTTLTLEWTTDEPASTEIEFEDYGLFGDASTLQTDHSMSFYIDSGTTYYFTFIATDASGNTAEDGVWYSAP